MYERKLPDDSRLLRSLAEEQWQQRVASGKLPKPPADTAAAGIVRELQIQNLELELKLAEAERVKELLTAAINGAPDAIFVKDTQGKYLLINEAAAKVAGRSCDDILGHDDHFLFNQTDAQAIIDEDRGVMRRGVALAIEQKLDLNGTPRNFWSVKAPFRNAQGQVIGITGCARDDTDFKVAEKALKESEQRFRTLADNLPDSLYLLDPHEPAVPLKILYANKAAAENDGYVVNQLIGHSIITMLDTPLSRAEAAERMARVMAGEVIEFEVEHVHRLGHAVPYEVRAVAIPWQGRTLILGMNRNIAVRRQAEAALRENEMRLAEAQEIGGLGSFGGEVAEWRGRCLRALCKIFCF